MAPIRAPRGKALIRRPNCPACSIRRPTFVQNCNSSPFTTTDEGNPDRGKVPALHGRRRRPRQAPREDVAADAWPDARRDARRLKAAAYDTTLYWPQHELPKYAEKLRELEKTDPAAARRVRPYLEHLLDWDCRITAESTQATLCTAWYEELFGDNYPGETMKPTYADNASAQFTALVLAAGKLRSQFGDWKVPWGDVHRAQRSARMWPTCWTSRSTTAGRVSRRSAGHGPMGVILTQYYSPPLYIPFLKNLKHKYGLIGATYMGVYEFGDRIEGATVLHFGQSGDPQLAPYFDQARLLSDGRFKRELFYWDDVLDGHESASTDPAAGRSASPKRTQTAKPSDCGRSFVSPTSRLYSRSISSVGYIRFGWPVFRSTDGSALDLFIDESPQWRLV